MHGHIGDRKEITLLRIVCVCIYIYIYISNTLFYLVVQVLHLTEYDFYDLHTSVPDWCVTMVRWLFMPFS